MAACARRLVESASKPDAKPGYAAVEDETVVNPFSIVGDDDDDEEEASDGELSTRSPATSTTRASYLGGKRTGDSTSLRRGRSARARALRFSCSR